MARQMQGNHAGGNACDWPLRSRTGRSQTQTYSGTLSLRGEMGNFAQLPERFAEGLRTRECHRGSLPSCGLLSTV